MMCTPRPEPAWTRTDPFWLCTSRLVTGWTSEMVGVGVAGGGRVLAVGARMGEQAGTGHREHGRGGQAGQAPDPAPVRRHRAHGRSTVSRVGPPGGVAVSKMAATASRSVARP